MLSYAIPTAVYVVCFLMLAGRLTATEVDANLINSGPSEDEIDKIIGGEVVKRGEHKYMAYMEFNPKFVGCGATLISDRHVLTAAHCVMDPDTGVLDDKETIYLNVYTVEPMDSTSMLRFAYKKDFKIHPQYNYKAPGKGYDIAILKFNPPLTSWDMSKLDKIRLGEENKDLSFIQTLALGWGKTSDAAGPVSPNLKQAKLKVLSRSECQTQWGTNYNHDIQICTAPSNTQICTGDSGGPLLWQKYDKIPGTNQINRDKINGYQIGIVSFSKGSDAVFVTINRKKFYVDPYRRSSSRASPTRCVQGSVFTRVQYFINNGWIAANMI